MIRRGGDVQYVSHRGAQRSAFLGQARMCLGIGLPAAGIAGVAWALDGSWQIAAGCAVLFMVIAGYYFRVAEGWVYFDAVSLRTSRWVRGRRFRWDEIAGVESKTWHGKGGGVTVAVVRTRSGRSYYLPAPRSTRGEREPAFRRDLRRLQGRVRSR